MFTYSPYPTVGKVINIIDLSFGVDQLDQIFYNGNDIFLGQDLLVHSNIQSQFFVHSITSNLSKVITLIGKEQFIYNTTCCFLIGWLSITQLTIDMFNSLFFRVRWILLKGVMDNGIITLCIILFVQKNSLHISFQYLIYVIFFQNSITVQDNLISFNRYYFASILIHKILMPCIQYSRRQFTAQYFFQAGIGNLNLFRKVKYLQNILIPFKTNSSEQGSNR